MAQELKQAIDAGPSALHSPQPWPLSTPSPSSDIFRSARHWLFLTVVFLVHRLVQETMQ